METYSVTVRTKDGIAVWGGIASIGWSPYGLILNERTPDGEVHAKAGYAHGYWESFQTISEAQAEDAKE